MQDARKKLFTKLGEVLSSDQISEYQKMLEERRKARRQNRTKRLG